MAKRKLRLAPQVYETIKELLSEGKKPGDIFDELKSSIPGLTRTHVHSQSYQYKRQHSA